MKSQRCISFTFLIILVLATGLYASQYEIGEMKVSGMKWGPQNVTVKLVSHNLYYRFVLAETNISYSGISQVTSRHSIKKFIIEPQSDTSLVIPIEIPGGFGTGSVNVTLYDVVDTLDTPTESQAFYTGQIPMTISIISSIAFFCFCCTEGKASRKSPRCVILIRPSSCRPSNLSCFLNISGMKETGT